ncbi:MAG: protein kinase domain-containing protein [Planctomycetaceae bacterium]
MHHNPITSPPPETDLLLEAVVGAGYRPVKVIGVGGMGVVYRAWDHTTDRYVVLKVPRRALLADPAFRERFDREMQAARRMTHPHVVPVLDFGIHDDLPFAVLQYMAGGTLDGRRPTQSGRPLAAKSALLRQWLVEVADALDHVHANGYVHRDVKPANILFDGRGRPYLGDFGIAKAVGERGADEPAVGERGADEPGPGLTAAGFAIGTPEYIAPEIVLGREADGRADQYSLAVAVFEFLTTRVPIVAGTGMATMVAQATQPAPDLWTIRPELPRSLCLAVARALAKDPARRFATCREFVDIALCDVPDDQADPQPRLSCPSCGELIGVAVHLAGRGGTCPKCSATLRIAVDLEAIVLPDESVPRPRPGTARPQQRDATSGPIAAVCRVVADLVRKFR